MTTPHTDGVVQFFFLFLLGRFGASCVVCISLWSIAVVFVQFFFSFLIEIRLSCTCDTNNVVCINHIRFGVVASQSLVVNRFACLQMKNAKEKSNRVRSCFPFDSNCLALACNSKTRCFHRPFCCDFSSSSSSSVVASAPMSWPGKLFSHMQSLTQNIINCLRYF